MPLLCALSSSSSLHARPTSHLQGERVMSHALAAPRLAPASSRSSGPSSPCCCVVAASATRSARVVAGSGVNPRRGRGLVSARAVADPSPAAAAAAPAAALPPLPPLNAAYEAQCAFSPAASWLLPGRLLAGAYPFVAPPPPGGAAAGAAAAVVSSHADGEALLEEIVSRGPHVFVSLQAELPAQAELPIGGAKGFLPYKPAVELIAAAHTPPPPGAVVNGVRHPQLDRFLPPKRRHSAASDAAAAAAAAYYAAERVAFVRHPMAAGEAPSQEQLRAAVDDLAARLLAGDALYLHGWRGAGRSGVVGACLLAKLYGIGADEALERVQRSHDSRNAGGDGASPEAAAQREAVRAFVAAL